jgi:hypothetical protein
MWDHATIAVAAGAAANKTPPIGGFRLDRKT